MAKTKTGIVVSNKMEKTAVVRVDRMVPHKKYGKPYRVSKKFAVHDEHNAAQMGTTVTIEEIRPMSKTKRWGLVTAPSVEVSPAKSPRNEGKRGKNPRQARVKD